MDHETEISVFEFMDKMHECQKAFYSLINDEPVSHPFVLRKAAELHKTYCLAIQVPQQKVELQTSGDFDAEADRGCLITRVLREQATSLLSAILARAMEDGWGDIR